MRINAEALRLFRPAPAVAPRGRATGAAGRRQQIALGNDARLSSFLAQLRLEPGQVKRGELALLDPDSGETLAMWVTSTEVRDDLGAVAGVVTLLQDLAPIRELERRRVEQALFESEKLAATGRLAASIAHEINNPLEAIKNSLYLLVNTHPGGRPQLPVPGDRPQGDGARLAHPAPAARLLPRRTPAWTPPTSTRLIVEAEGLLEPHLRQRGVRVQNHLGRDLPPIRASADQIKQVLLNLLLNAQQAMPEGGTINVSTEYGAARGAAGREFRRSDTVHVVVRDTGTGIAEEHLPHIFEPFFSTKEEKGTGLGLWVSFGIVQRHGGRIRVRSRPGRGTTFTITLPVSGPPPRRRPRPARGPARPGRSGGP